MYGICYKLFYLQLKENTIEFTKKDEERRSVQDNK